MLNVKSVSPSVSIRTTIKVCEKQERLICGLEAIYMRKLLITLLMFIFYGYAPQAQPVDKPLKNRYVLVIHGGAGAILKSEMTPEREQTYSNSLKKALQSGYSILKNGGSSIDAVEASVKVLEDDPLFNAGKGAVFTSDGKIELDAAIMNGRSLEAGAVAGITIVKNPISAARAVMEKSNHVMMIGAGAEQFAKSTGLETVDPSYFYTEERWNALQKIKHEDSVRDQLNHRDSVKRSGNIRFKNNDRKFGTVGAVALDQSGNLAAATSSGGLTNKKYGRVGDVPIIGAGTYANNKTCAISCTGYGEYFIRLVMAKSVSDMMEFGRMSLKDASQMMIMKKLPELGGDGGLIAIDKDGNIATPFNTAGMYRGYIRSDGIMQVKIYKE
jgi:beta-aspartyl-peptidase (threonine type)